MNNRYLSIGFLLFMLVTLISCTSSETTTLNTPHQIQEWVEVGDYDVFVYEIIDNPEKIDGKAFIYIEVGYENNRSNEELSCRDGQWVLYDTQGYSYEPEWGEYQYEEHGLHYLGGERFLNRGTNLRGWLIFEIPDDAILDRLQFFTGYLDTKSVDFLLE